MTKVLIVQTDPKHKPRIKKKQCVNVCFNSSNGCSMLNILNKFNQTKNKMKKLWRLGWLYTYDTIIQFEQLKKKQKNNCTITICIVCKNIQLNY